MYIHAGIQGGLPSTGPREREGIEAGAQPVVCGGQLLAGQGSRHAGDLGLGIRAIGRVWRFGWGLHPQTTHPTLCLRQRPQLHRRTTKSKNRELRTDQNSRFPGSLHPKVGSRSFGMFRLLKAEYPKHSETSKQSYETRPQIDHDLSEGTAVAISGVSV